jgi:energy-coupling factor transporter ATP-binding protein EcfA2
MILGIAGPKGSGKSTLANLLVNVGWKRTGFAQPIKSMMRTLLLYQGADNHSVDQMLNGDLKETRTEFLCGQTPRWAMQTLGTEWRNLVDKELWTEAWKRNIRSYPSGTKILVDDLRFLHEARAVRNFNGKVILITRPGTGPGTHASEKEYLEISYDGAIVNDSTPEQMLTNLGSIMEYWK